MERFLTLRREEHFMFIEGYDQKMLKLIETRHADVSLMVDVQPLLELIINILKLSSTTISKRNHTKPIQYAMDSLEKKIPSAKTLEGLIKDTHKISCKISFKLTREGAGDDNAVSVLIETLSCYSWDAKVVLVMAAFVITYGGFLFSLRAVGTDKWMPLNQLGILIQAMVNLTMDFIDAGKQLPPEHSLSPWIVQNTVYWTIRSVVACVPHISGFLGLGHEYTPSDVEVKELGKLIEKLHATHHQIRVELDPHTQYIERENIFEYRQKLKLLFQKTQPDNIMILKASIDAEDDQPPLFQICTQKRFGLEVLAKKNVLLLVSWELTFDTEEIWILVEMYRNTKKVNDYELVCLPIGKTSKSQRQEFKNMVTVKKLPWYLVHDDYSINHAVVVEYIQKVWHFNNRPILVVLNPQGKLISKNAFDNIGIWGRSSINIDLSVTVKTVEECWAGATWGLELLFQNIEEGKNVIEWMNSNQIICLYGGEDTNWVMKLAIRARAAMAESNVQMVYMGARNQTNQLNSIFSEIQTQSLSYCSPKLASEFWVRLESIRRSRMEFIAKVSIDEEEDDIIKEIRSFLTYNSSEKGWAVICKGSKIVVKAKGNIILDCFEQYDDLKKANPQKESLDIVIDYVKKHETKIH